MKSKKENYLWLVRNEAFDTLSHTTNKKNSDPKLQVDMFEGNSENTIIIIFVSDINGSLLSDAIKKAQPKYIIDMRLNPRFDTEGFSRRTAFDEFRRLGSKYIDYVELVGANNKKKDYLIEAAESIFKDANKGPIVFLFGNKEQDQTYEEKLIHHLPLEKDKWILAEVP